MESLSPGINTLPHSLTPVVPRPYCRPRLDYNSRVRRILALDLGERRIGLAVSDPLGLTAQGLKTLERSNRRNDLKAIREAAEQYQVGLILVGQPLHMSGHAGTQAERAQAFAEDLRRRLGLEVRLWDERLTTVEAQRVLRSSGIGREKRRQAVDRLAAVLLLQSYLDWMREEAGGHAGPPLQSQG